MSGQPTQEAVELSQEAVERCAAALALGHLAVLFAAQPETWPVFSTWVRRTSPGLRGLTISREDAAVLAEELADGMDTARGMLA